MPSVLIVEDEESILLALEDDFKMEGYDVASASDGALGLSMARDGSYDLILLDVMLPKLDGFDVPRATRPSAPRADVPTLEVMKGCA